MERGALVTIELSLHKAVVRHQLGAGWYIQPSLLMHAAAGSAFTAVVPPARREEAQTLQLESRNTY